MFTLHGEFYILSYIIKPSRPPQKEAVCWLNLELIDHMLRVF